MEDIILTSTGVQHTVYKNEKQIFYTKQTSGVKQTLGKKKHRPVHMNFRPCGAAGYSVVGDFRFCPRANLVHLLRVDFVSCLGVKVPAVAREGRLENGTCGSCHLRAHRLLQTLAADRHGFEYRGRARRLFRRRRLGFAGVVCRAARDARNARPSSAGQVIVKLVDVPGAAVVSHVEAHVPRPDVLLRNADLVVRHRTHDRHVSDAAVAWPFVEDDEIADAGFHGAAIHVGG